jgi:hypothetical protein
MTQEQLKCPVLTIACTRLNKPGVGTVHLHRRRWRPRRVVGVVFENAHGGRFSADQASVEDILASTSLLEAMAVIRRT